LLVHGQFVGKLALYTEGVAQFSVLMLQYLAVQGVAGGVWFAAGAVIQIFFFGIVAVEIKRRAPTAHTVLEIVAIRWGNKARVVCPISHLNCCPLTLGLQSLCHQKKCNPGQ